MRRIIALILLVVLCLAAPLFADATSPDAGSQTGTALEGQWWYGRTIEAFTFNGLQNVSQRTAGAVVISGRCRSAERKRQGTGVM